jgi:hypothetical protein
MLKTPPFSYLSEILWPAADALILKYKANGFHAKREQPIQKADEYRPTLIFEKRFAITEIVEIKQEYRIDGPLFDFIQKCLAEQRPVKIWICVSKHKDDEDPSIQVIEEKKFKSTGVGRYYYDNGGLSVLQDAVEFHLRVVLPPGIRLNEQKQIDNAIKKFNEGGRVDAIRDCGELLEDAVTKLGIYAINKGKLTSINAQDFNQLDFEKKIDRLNIGAAGVRIIEEPMKIDLKAVKNTRNLSDHPRDRMKQKSFEEQCLSKMQESIRLLRDLERIKQSLR